MTVTTHTGASLEEAKKVAYQALGETAIIVEMTELDDGRVAVKAISKDGQQLRNRSSGLNFEPIPDPSEDLSLNAFADQISSEGEMAGESQRDNAPLAAHAGNPVGSGRQAVAGASSGVSGLKGLAARAAGKHEAMDKLISAPSGGAADRPNGTGLHKSIEKKSSEEALRDLRGHLAGKLMGQEVAKSPFHLFLREKLTLHGLSSELIAALDKAAEAHAESVLETDEGFKAALARAFDKVLSFSTFPMLKTHPLMLVGQTGAGKTSSAAKIAALAARTGQQVTFFTADTSRAGAIDQIATYAEALNTQFREVDDPAKIVQILDYERPDGIVVLDTPGISPFAAEDLAAIRAFRDALKAEPVLVLPASGDVQEHSDWVAAFSDFGVKRCIITKFDTSKRIGAAVNAAYQHQLDLAYFSETPFIADGIMVATARYLADRFLISQPARLATKTE